MRISELAVVMLPLPNSMKGSNEPLTEAEKQHLVETALSDADHCQMTFAQLAEAGMYYIYFLFKLLILYM